ncbi:DUF885 family protein [Massilia sp. TS11]|uniref:DUF885 domain-containing protein n=1 Tax=Massilia sp. TS11 TaxID=2908003 RepID=UPI001EDBCAA7|nr:DUF885 domain-containing protein [Massilia sp. TS11]MCG2583121.1 DUF885 domain-containing protein [Massilia sp. TS11]
MKRLAALSLSSTLLLAAWPALAQDMQRAVVPPPPRLAVQAPAQRLADLAESYYQTVSRFEPLGPTFAGDNSFDELISPGLQPAQRARYFGLLQSLQQDLAAIDRSQLCAADRLSYDDLSFELRQLRAFEAFPEHLLPMNQMDALPVTLANFASGDGAQPLNTPAQYEAYRKRLAALPGWIEMAIANMRSGIKTGVVLPRSLVESLLPQLRSLAAGTPASSVYLQPLQRMPASFSALERSKFNLEYKEAVGQILPALKRLVDFVETEYLPAARTTAGYGALPNGAAWYRAAVALNTTTELTPDEIHAIGLAEMDRIDAELAKVGARLGYTGKPAGLAAWLAAQPQFTPFKTEDAVLDGYRAIYAKVQARLPALFGTLPKSALEIRPEPPLTRDAASDHYTAGAADLSRPGVFWAVITDPARYASTRMTALFLHEGAPGHHFQISRQAELALPKFRRFNGNGAFIEGWALYAETLGKEMGLYENDPNAYAGWLMADMVRAARLVVDTGLHAKGWTREQTIAFLMERVGNTEAQARNATERYMAWPGQALAYKIGALKIQALRQRAEQALGPRFKLADFHDAVLANGALPLSMLEAEITAWIARQKG